MKKTKELPLEILPSEHVALYIENLIDYIKYAQPRLFHRRYAYNGFMVTIQKYRLEKKEKQKTK